MVVTYWTRPSNKPGKYHQGGGNIKLSILSRVGKILFFMQIAVKLRETWSN